MYKRKKYLGIKMVVLLLFLLLNLFEFSTTCYARTQITQEEAEYICNSFWYYKESPRIYNNLISVNQIIVPSQNFYSQNNAIAFMNYFNQNNTLDFNSNNILFFNKMERGTSYPYAYSGTIYYAIMNFGKYDNLPHLLIQFGSPNNYRNYPLELYSVDDDKNIIEYEIKAINYNFNNGLTFTGTTTSNLNTPKGVKFMQEQLTWNKSNTNSSTISEIKGIVTFSSTNAVFTNYDGTTFYSPAITKLLETSYSGDVDLNPEVPENPSGDIGGTTGTITNPSGEVTGQIDLTGIENGIKDVKDTISGEGQAIRENDNKNTEQIVNAINNSNENYWGSGESLTGEEQEQQIETNINEIMNNLEEQITQTEIMEELERSRSRLSRFL